jgi:hypothetical protein
VINIKAAKEVLPLCHPSAAQFFSPNALSLDACLRHFELEERLGEQDMWYCNRCKTHVRAYKCMSIYKAPEVLVVHLKRFRSNGGHYQQKVSSRVAFPVEGLDLTSYVRGPQASSSAGPLLYDLYAVSEHAGGMGGGHYTAKAMNFLNNQWFDFNDSYVSQARAADAVSAAAYLLFYRRRKPGVTVPGSPFAAGEPVDFYLGSSVLRSSVSDASQGANGSSGPGHIDENSEESPSSLPRSCTLDLVTWKGLTEPVEEDDSPRGALGEASVATQDSVSPIILSRQPPQRKARAPVSRGLWDDDEDFPPGL